MNRVERRRKKRLENKVNIENISIIIHPRIAKLFEIHYGHNEDRSRGAVIIDLFSQFIFSDEDEDDVEPLYFDIPTTAFLEPMQSSDIEIDRHGKTWSRQEGWLNQFLRK